MINEISSVYKSYHWDKDYENDFHSTKTITSNEKFHMHLSIDYKAYY